MRRILDWFLQHKLDWKSFLRSLLPFSWLLLPLSLLIFSSIYQAGQAIEKTRQVPVEKMAEIHSQSDGILFLHIVFPQEIELSEAGKAKAPLSIWLSYATPYPPFTATATLDKKASAPVAATTADKSTETSQTPASTPTPTVIPYLLSLDVTPAGLTFTDKDGQPVPAQVALTPSRFGATPAVLFMQVNPNSGDEPLNIAPSIRDTNGLLPLPAISIKPETQSAARQRLFWSLMLTPTLIGALLVALASLAIQQWGKAEDERREKAKKMEDERRDKEKTAQDEQKKRKEQIENLKMLIKDKPAEGARQYLEIQKATGESQFLGEIWSGAPEELKNLVELERTYKNRDELKQVIEKLGKEKVEQALKLALQHRLDEDWESRAAAILQEIIRHNLLPLDGQLLLLAEQRNREALLKVWPDISYWRLASPPDRDAPILDKWKFYAEDAHPVGAPHAEENIWLFNNRFDGRYSDQKALDGIERIGSVIIIGTPGWGKTSTALWLMDYALQSKIAFPVYIPAAINISLAEIAPIFAKTILHYLAINPSAFLKRGIAGRASIAHLFAKYLEAGSKLTLLLREAGLPSTGAGLEVEQELLRLTKESSFKPPQKEQEILTLLSESYPDGFSTTWLLMDVQEELDGKSLDHFFDLITKLNRIGLKTKILMSSAADSQANLGAVPIPVRRDLKWGADDLKGLIATRLQRLGEESLTALCKPEVRQHSKTPEERLAAAAEGKPGILAQKGNELLKRISQKQDLLSEHDLNEILGPA